MLQLFELPRREGDGDVADLDPGEALRRGDQLGRGACGADPGGGFEDLAVALLQGQRPASDDLERLGEGGIGDDGDDGRVLED